MLAVLRFGTEVWVIIAITVVATPLIYWGFSRDSQYAKGNKRVGVIGSGVMFVVGLGCGLGSATDMAHRHDAALSFRAHGLELLSLDRNEAHAVIRLNPGARQVAPTCSIRFNVQRRGDSYDLYLADETSSSILSREQLNQIFTLACPLPKG